MIEIISNYLIQDNSNLNLFLYFLAGFILIATLFPLLERGIYFIIEKLSRTFIPNINYRYIRYIFIVLRALVIVIILLAFYFSSLPVKILIILCVLNLLFRENFPFSHYPMYSKFSSDTRYIYITDENDNPIPLKTAFGIKSDFLKKVYMNEVNKIAKINNTDYWLLHPSELKPAAKFTLNYLQNVERSKKAKKNYQYKVLNLYHVNIFIKDYKIEKQGYLVDKLNLC